MKERLKILMLMMVVIAFTLSCSQNKGNKNNDGINNDTPKVEVPELTFDKNTHDFGKIIAGERVAYAFRFTNTGNSPLIITGIRSGCGCTVGDYPKDPLKTGDQARINVVFNSAGRKGFQSESVTVLNNSLTPMVVLRITAEVLEQ
jgi:hypothetical protein